MRIFVPATQTGLHPRTLPALLGQWQDVTVVPMHTSEAYYNLLHRLWRRGEDFAIVEHDIEVGPDAMRGFNLCEQPWCAHSYNVYAGDVATAYGGAFALGCVRFRRELLVDHPDAVEEAGKLDLHPVHEPRSYAVMDSTLTQILRSRSLHPHQHLPNVEHHHRYQRPSDYVAPYGARS